MLRSGARSRSKSRESLFALPTVTGTAQVTGKYGYCPAGKWRTSIFENVGWLHWAQACCMVIEAWLVVFSLAKQQDL